MKWSTLFQKIGKQPLRVTNHQTVHAILRNPKTRKMERVNLILRFNTDGSPYFIQDPNDYKEIYSYQKEQDKNTKKSANSSFVCQC